MARAPLNESMWAAILIGIAALVGLFFAMRFHDVAYISVLVWALLGIYVKQNDATLVAYTAGGLALLLALAIIYVGTMQFLTRNR